MRLFVLERYTYKVGANAGLINVVLRLLGPHALAIRPKLIGSLIMKDEARRD